MPPKSQNRKPAFGNRGNDPTATKTAAATALFSQQVNQPAVQEQKDENKNNDTKSNDDLKKLIDSLKSKIASSANMPQQKQLPPAKKDRKSWNRSITHDGTWTPKPAYTVLTRISNHEKVPTTVSKPADVSIKSLPHSFLYRPGADGIKVDKVEVKSGKQLGFG